jgi:opacity protein-like surface antigen
LPNFNIFDFETLVKLTFANMSLISRLLLFILTSSPLFTTAQSAKEFLVTNDNDTIFGSVSFNRKSPRNVSFRGINDASSREYSVSEIKFFYLKSLELYESVETSESGERTFLKVLAYGRISLYKLQKGFLMIKEGKEYKLDKRDTVINNYAYEDKKYIDLLKVLTSDCEKLATKSRSVSYNENALTAFVSKYNNCDGVVEKSKAHSTWEQTMIGVKGGLSISKMVFPAEESVYHKFDFAPKSSQVYGIFLSFPLSERLSAVADFIQIKERGGDEVGVNTKEGSDYSKEEAHFKFRYHQVGVSLRYFPVLGRFRPFATGGVFLGQTPTVTSIRKISFGGSAPYSVRKDLDLSGSSSRKEFGFTVGAGLNTEIGKRGVVGLTYNYENAFANYVGKKDRFNFLSHYLTISAAYKLNGLFRRQQ